MTENNFRRHVFTANDGALCGAVAIPFYIAGREFVGTFDMDGAMEALSEQRREQVMRFKHEAGRRQSTAAYLLLREALHREYGIDGAPVFGYHDGGKPFLADRRDVHFSLSHCRSGVACAVGGVPVGIDIESIRPYKPALARHVLSDGELERVEKAERRDVEFIRQWTMKESLLKLTGEGIRRDLTTVLDDGGFDFSTVTDLRQGFVCTVCTRKPS